MSAERQEREKGRFVMTMHNIVTDEQLGKYFRRMTAIGDRLGKSLPFEKVMGELQLIFEGEFQSVVKIDRSNPFDFSFFRGSPGCAKDHHIIEEDANALSRELIDCAKVELLSTLGQGEEGITGDERIKRLKLLPYLRLDINTLFTLWKNKHLIPESWKAKTNGEITYIYFDGTIVLSEGVRYVFYLHWAEWDFNKWFYGWAPLHMSLSRNSVSAVIKLT